MSYPIDENHAVQPGLGNHPGEILKEEPFVRKQRLLVWISCLLLGAVSGCNNHPTTSQSKHHPPVNGGIDANGNASNGPTKSVLVDEGGTLTIALPKPGTTFEIESTDLDGNPSPVCANEASTFTTTVDVTCPVVAKDGDYTVKVREQAQAPNGSQPPTAPIEFTAYIRSCKNCK